MKKLLIGRRFFHFAADGRKCGGCDGSLRTSSATVSKVCVGADELCEAAIGGKAVVKPCYPVDQAHRVHSVCDDCIVGRSLALLVNCYVISALEMQTAPQKNGPKAVS